MAYEVSVRSKSYYHTMGNQMTVLVQTEKFKPGSYVELRTSQVPYGWSNRPAHLGVNVNFAGEADDIKTTMMTEYNIPGVRPILTDRKSLYLLEGGDKKYYLWNDVSGYVARIEEPSLQKILTTLGSRGLSDIPYTILTC
jgi:hypothetical protein